MLHDAPQATMLTHKLQSRLWPDTFDWFEVVTAKKDAQVDELRHLHFESFESKLEVYFVDGLLFCLGEGEVAVQDWRIKRESIHVFRSCCVYLYLIMNRRLIAVMISSTFPPRASSAHWASASEGALQAIRTLVNTNDIEPYNDNWNAHKLEQSAAFLIVFSCYFDRPSRKAIHIFRGA